MQHSVKQLKPGDTLYLRQGIYYESVYLTQSGTPEAPITISAYPGELPILDGGLREFYESPAKSWQPFEGGVPGEYASVKRYPNADRRILPHQFLPGSWEPMWGIEDQRPLVLGRFADSMVPLHGYRNLEDLRSTNELKSPSKKAGALYCGPGVWYNRNTQRHPYPARSSSMAGVGTNAPIAERPIREN